MITSPNQWLLHPLYDYSTHAMIIPSTLTLAHSLNDYSVYPTLLHSLYYYPTHSIISHPNPIITGFILGSSVHTCSFHWDNSNYPTPTLVTKRYTQPTPIVTPNFDFQLLILQETKNQSKSTEKLIQVTDGEIGAYKIACLSQNCRY